MKFRCLFTLQGTKKSELYAGMQLAFFAAEIHSTYIYLQRNHIETKVNQFSFHA